MNEQKVSANVKIPGVTGFCWNWMPFEKIKGKLDAASIHEENIKTPYFYRKKNKMLAHLNYRYETEIVRVKNLFSQASVMQTCLANNLSSSNPRAQALNKQYLQKIAEFYAEIESTAKELVQYEERVVQTTQAHICAYYNGVFSVLANSFSIPLVVEPEEVLSGRDNFFLHLENIKNKIGGTDNV